MAGGRCGHVFRDYEDVRTRAGAVANGVAALDITAGDRVAIYLPNEIAFIEASIGIGMLGAIPVPVNWHWQGAELAYLLDDSDSKVIFADTTLPYSCWMTATSLWLRSSEFAATDEAEPLASSPTTLGSSEASPSAMRTTLTSAPLSVSPLARASLTVGRPHAVGE
jgi:acyl-CoA synthetase (AMP-forming)/AMP-acid ligase II